MRISIKRVNLLLTEASETGLRQNRRTYMSVDDIIFYFIIILFDELFRVAK